MTTVKLRDENETSKVTVALPQQEGQYVGRITDPALNVSSSQRRINIPSMPDNLPPLPERPSRHEDHHHEEEPRRERHHEDRGDRRRNAREEHRELQRVQEDELEIDPTLDFISNPAKTRQRMKDTSVSFERTSNARHHYDDDDQHDSHDSHEEDMMRDFQGMRMEDLDLSGEADEPLFPPPQPKAPAPQPTAPQQAAGTTNKPVAVDPKEEAKKLKAEVDKMLADLAVWAKNPEYSGYIKNLTHKSQVEDIRACHAKVKAIRSQDAGLKITRKLLLGFTGLVEWLNSAYDPCGLLLNDWSKDVESNITDFDDVLIRIWEKYGKYLHEANPLIELMLALTLSAGTYHMTQKFIRDQEEIARQYEAQAAAQREANARSHTNDRQRTRPHEDDEVDEDEPLPEDEEYVEKELKSKPKKTKRRKPRQPPPGPPIQTNVRPQPSGPMQGPQGMTGLMSMMGGMLGSSGGMPAMFAAMRPKPPSGGGTGFSDLDALLNDNSNDDDLPPGSPTTNRVEEIDLPSSAAEENTDVTIPLPSPTSKRGRSKKTLAVD